MGGRGCCRGEGGEGEGGYLRGASVFLPMIGRLVVVGSVWSFPSGGDGLPGAVRGVEPHLTRVRKGGGGGGVGGRDKGLTGCIDRVY